MGWRYITDHTGGLPSYTFQLMYITGRIAYKPDTDTTLNYRAIELCEYLLIKAKPLELSQKMEAHLASLDNG